MATFYIPNATGWASTLIKGTGYGHLRIRVDQTYNAAGNTSSLRASIEIKSDGTGSGDGYRMQDGGSFRFPKNNSSPATIDTSYRLANLSTTAWNPLYYEGSAKYWTVSVTHNTDGTLTVYGAVSGLRLRNADTSRIWGWDNSDSVTITNYPAYSLGISIGEGSAIGVNRTASPAGASLGNLAAGATIYRGDVLTVTFAANTGYALTSKTVNGSAVSGTSTTLTVTASVTAAATAARLSYTLTIEADENSLVTVTRGGSALNSGDTIYYGDALTVLALPQPGYELTSATINGVAFTGQTSVNVTGDVTVSVEVSALGFAHLYRSGAFIPYLIYLWHLSAWARYRAFLWKSGAWAAF